MNLSIPATRQELLALRQSQAVSAEVVASAIAGVIQLARAEGRSLAEVTAELLEDDPFLPHSDRVWLSELVASAWQQL